MMDQTTCSDDSYDLPWSGNTKIKIMILLAQKKKINLGSTTYSLHNFGQISLCFCSLAYKMETIVAYASKSCWGD